MRLQVAVKKTFPSFAIDMSFTASQNYTGIFGPSGSGKSSLVNMIAGLVRPDKGLISFDGETLFEEGKINVPPQRRRMGIIFQRPNLFPHLSVKANLLYGYKRCRTRQSGVAFDQLIAVLQLEHLLARGVNNLSGGEKQRVAIGRAVLSNPCLLLMDEPLAGLDDTLRFQIIQHLKLVSETFHIPFLFISHSLLEMRLMVDSVLVINDGFLIEQTSSEQLARSRMGINSIGYINILKLGSSRKLDDSMYAYKWGPSELYISAGRDKVPSTFELSSRDIILFKKHPEAISARNLFKCSVVSIFESEGRIGVELSAGKECCMVAEVVGQAVEELEISVGCELYAAIKASAFRVLD